MQTLCHQHHQTEQTQQARRGASDRPTRPVPLCLQTQMGGHTAYVERTNLTSRQMDARLVRKTLSFSKRVAAPAWEDAVYNLVRPLKTLRQEATAVGRCWQARSPAMAAGLTDHLWTLKELLLTVVIPAINSI